MGNARKNARGEIATTTKFAEGRDRYDARSFVSIEDIFIFICELLIRLTTWRIATGASDPDDLRRFGVALSPIQSGVPWRPCDKCDCRPGERLTASPVAGGRRGDGRAAAWLSDCSGAAWLRPQGSLLLLAGLLGSGFGSAARRADNHKTAAEPAPQRQKRRMHLCRHVMLPHVPVNPRPTRTYDTAMAQMRHLLVAMQPHQILSRPAFCPDGCSCTPAMQAGQSDEERKVRAEACDASWKGAD